MSKRLALYTFGGLRIERDGETDTAVGSRKVEALFAYLAITTRPHPRELLAELLWDDRSQKVAMSNLRRVLTGLRQHFGDYVTITRETAVFQPNPNLWLDVHDLQTRLAPLTAGSQALSAEMVAEAESALALYQGEFLAGFTVREASGFESWLTAEREHWQQQVLTALTTLGSYYEAIQLYPRGIAAAQRALQIDALQETAHQQLMRLLALNGRRAEALSQYETCRQLLWNELGITPAPETKALYAAIMAGELTAVPLRSMIVDERGVKSEVEEDSPSPLLFHLTYPPPHNLPSPATPFIGRSIELAALNNLLLQPTVRLITIVGPGGMGKTRLAIQVAGKWLTVFAHGLYFVPLTAISRPEDLPSAIASSLNISFYGSASPKAQLLNYLRPKAMLLILDNFEQLLTAWVEENEDKSSGVNLLSEIVIAAPQMKLLITSRERLHLQEEWVYELGGMTFPQANVDQNSKANYSAIELFSQRARQTQPHFDLAAEYDEVVRICQLVAAMPLGLELAAVWVKLMPCQEIATEIERNLDFLATPLRNVPERQRSLRAVFEHSWHLLPAEEQQILRRLSVFRGGFLRGAAGAVTGASLFLLSALVDKSLLRVDSSGRYNLHELLRQFVAEKLHQHPDEEDQTYEQHGRYYLTFLGHQEHHLKGAKLKEAKAAIAADIDNVRLAWHWAAEGGWLTAIKPAMASLWLFYEASGRLLEGEYAFANVVVRLRLSCDQPAIVEKETLTEICLLLGQALGYQGWFQSRRGLFKQAKALIQESLTILRVAGDSVRRETAFSLYFLGNVLEYGDSRATISLFQESLRLYQESGDTWGSALVLMDLGQVVWGIGQYAEAEHLTQESIVLFKAIGEQLFIVYAISTLGYIAESQGQYSQAEAFLQESLRRRTELGDQPGVALTLRNLGFVALWQRQEVQAKQYFEQSIVLAKELSGPYRAITMSFVGLGFLAEMRGDYREAKELFGESLSISAEDLVGLRLSWAVLGLGWSALGLEEYEEAEQHFHETLTITTADLDSRVALRALVGLVLLRARAGTTERALELLALVLSHPACDQWTKERAISLQTRLTADLPPEVVAAAQARGRGLELWAIVEQLVQELTEMRRQEEVKQQGSKRAERKVRFVPEALIAVGGYGQVYRGHDTDTSQVVVIKRLKPELVAQQPDAVARFVREGELLRQLDHPNIVKMIASEEMNGEQFLIMEYVAGGSLRDLLDKEGQLSVARTLDIALELADALSRAHHLQIIHRDLKPGNVLLAEDGTPRLTDFGIARMTQREGTQLTQDGAMVGTIDYMSPEACRGKALDGRSDIWSLGILLHEMLTGMLPFQGEQITATILAIINAPTPDLLALRPDVPAALVQLIERMLVKEPEGRINQMRQVAADLERIRRGV